MHHVGRYSVYQKKTLDPVKILGVIPKPIGLGQIDFGLWIDTVQTVVHYRDRLKLNHSLCFHYPSNAIII